MWADLEDAGIAALENDARAIEIDGEPSWITGLADDLTREPDADNVFASIPSGVPIILMAHDPAAPSM